MYIAYAAFGRQTQHTRDVKIKILLTTEQHSQGVVFLCQKFKNRILTDTNCIKITVGFEIYKKRKKMKLKKEDIMRIIKDNSISNGDTIEIKINEIEVIAEEIEYKSHTNVTLTK